MISEASVSLEQGLNSHIAHFPLFDSKFALQPISPLAYWLVKTKNVTFRRARLFAWGVGLFFFFFFFFSWWKREVRVLDTMPNQSESLISPFLATKSANEVTRWNCRNCINLSEQTTFASHGNGLTPISEVGTLWSRVLTQICTLDSLCSNPETV